MWFRRDLRLHDNPALLAAGARGPVVPLFVLDPALWHPAGPVRQTWLARSLRALDADLRALGAPGLHVRLGNPLVEVPALVAKLARADSTGAAQVHAAADFGPYGRRRDRQLAEVLPNAGAELVFTGSPYAVAPGRVVKPSDGTPYRVYTPFYRAWCSHGWRAPAPGPQGISWAELAPGDGLASVTEPDLDGVRLPAVGEKAALARWEQFVKTALAGYENTRNRPDLAGTSRLSPHLRWGEIHPRTILAGLASHPDEPEFGDHDVFRKEIAWREFYADVLANSPRTARENLDRRYDAMEWDTGADADSVLLAWQQGRTGFPAVDAAMRQLLSEGWMHNRMRMVTASFLIKDLHLSWQLGARWFMARLADGDVASNSHGWQWTAGSGTDASPFFRVFNPIEQGKKFDPSGDYVRRYIPELAHLTGASAHEPWLAPRGYSHEYPQRIIDHATERAEALRRLQAIKAPS